jgi:hypothetical protein
LIKQKCFFIVALLILSLLFLCSARDLFSASNNILGKEDPGQVLGKTNSAIATISGTTFTQKLSCTHGSGDSALFSHESGSWTETGKIGSTYWKAIYFTTSVTTRFTSVDLWIKNPGSTLNATVEIWSTSTTPTSIANANATKTRSIITTGSLTEYAFDFATPFSLAAGTYAVIVKGTGTDMGGIAYDAEAGSLGTYYSTTNSGTGWTENTNVNVSIRIFGCQ